MEEEKILEVYHGTSKENADKIYKEQKFYPGQDEDNEDFLGKGIYFFKNFDHAVIWNLKKAKDMGKIKLEYDNYISQYAVLSTNIRILKENMLDLENIDDLVKYDKLCKRFAKEFEDDLEYINAKHKERAIINYLYKKGYMDNIFVIRQIIGQKGKTNNLNVVTHLQRDILCIKNSKIICEKINIVDEITKEKYNNIKYITFY